MVFAVSSIFKPTTYLYSAQVVFYIFYYPSVHLTFLMKLENLLKRTWKKAPNVYANF